MAMMDGYPLIVISMTRGLIQIFFYIFERCGLYVMRCRKIPFGVQWYADRKYFLNGHALRNVIDAGVNIGQTAIEVSKEFRGSKVTCF